MVYSLSRVRRGDIVWRDLTLNQPFLVNHVHVAIFWKESSLAKKGKRFLYIIHDNIYNSFETMYFFFQSEADYDSVFKLEYLDMELSETLRIHPPSSK